MRGLRCATHASAAEEPLAHVLPEEWGASAAAEEVQDGGVWSDGAPEAQESIPGLLLEEVPSQEGA